MSNQFTHVDAAGNPQMVDVSQKPVTRREAIARCVVIPGPEIIGQLKDGEIHTKKGPVFHTAIIAGTMGAKQTSSLIPFCHPLALQDCKVLIRVEENKIVIECMAVVEAKTGVEMEAITGATVAALTVYDMCKALSHDITIEEVRLMKKTGGKSDYTYG